MLGRRETRRGARQSRVAGAGADAGAGAGADVGAGAAEIYPPFHVRRTNIGAGMRAHPRFQVRLACLANIGAGIDSGGACNGGVPSTRHQARASREPHVCACHFYSALPPPRHASPMSAAARTVARNLGAQCLRRFHAPAFARRPRSGATCPRRFRAPAFARRPRSGCPILPACSAASRPSRLRRWLLTQPAWTPPATRR